MDLAKKIEEIRQKPESIRIRYVWGGVAIVMFFVVIVWVFSLSEMLGGIKKDTAENGKSIRDSFKEIQSIQGDLPSINEINNEVGSSLQKENQPLGDEGVKNDLDAQQKLDLKNNASEKEAVQKENPAAPIAEPTK
jgi:hypothetical protein